MKEYKKILDSMIKSSGLKLDEIADKCKEKGVEVTASYISKLRLGHRPAPDEVISRALAEVCNQDADQLVQAGHIERTPLPIVKKINQYEEMFVALMPTLIQLCDNKDFLDRVAISEGCKIPFEILSKLLEKMTVNEFIGFIADNGFSFNGEDNPDGSTKFWLEPLSDLSNEDKQSLSSMKEMRIINKDNISSLYNIKTNSLQLSSKEERDIAHDLEKMLSDLESDNALAFNGDPMDDDDKEMLRISLENSMRLAKQMAKKKFNPNKNKDKDKK